MFNAVAIHANPFHRQVVCSLAAESRMVTLQRITDSYPSETDLARIAGMPAPDVLFLDLYDPERSVQCLQELQARWPMIPVIGVGGTPAQYRGLGHFGVGHFLAFPMDLASFIATFAQAIRASNAQPFLSLTAFVPAKAGCGASTAALASATALAAMPGRRVLCIDGDLRSGILALALDVHPRSSTQGVLTAIHDLDRFRWESSVVRCFGADFLFSSGEAPNPAPEWYNYFAFLRFLDGRYDHILIDLPELVNPATEEVLRRAGAVFLVLTEEILSVRLAERRMTDLVKWGVPEGRIFPLLNRTGKNAGVAGISEALGRPVVFQIPNNYPAIQAAFLHRHWPLDPASNAGRAYAQFAHYLAGAVSTTAPPVAAEPARRPAAGISGLLRSLVANR
jgi:MinD-like ATPase involved in chromosome partitioning or flagellar assembly